MAPVRAKGELVNDGDVDLLVSLAWSEIDRGRSSLSNPKTMGNFAMKTVYLAHPYAERELGRGAQRTLEKEGFRVLNPFERPEQQEFDRSLAAGGLTDSQCDRLVRMDLAKIDESHLLAALLTEKTALGTPMEIFYARTVRA